MPKSGIVLRATAVGTALFAGCTVYDHHNCVEFSSIFGPCSWALSASTIAKCALIGFGATGLMTLAGLWITGVSLRGKS
jgi:hypothetical protein